MSEPWVSVDEVSRHLGVARDTIYRWIESRQMPAHRVGKLWKLKLSEVDQWVREGHAADNGQQPARHPRKKKTTKARKKP